MKNGDIIRTGNVLKTGVGEGIIRTVFCDDRGIAQVCVVQLFEKHADGNEWVSVDLSRAEVEQYPVH